MEDDVLARVISVEKEIQARLDAERVMSREWLEVVKKAEEEEFAREEEQTREAFRKSAEHFRDEAAARAGKVVKDAEEKAERLLALSDETLRGIIMRRLHMIVPE
jgi:cell division septum initiation protein DivIVA